ncbi:hypothetical protein [Cognatilysobacter lacus]|uniref:Uncharacterized protein n=1 Tax=Cognatilysobacter lacus TaxID=1643323 RepID=A0A5D8Z9F3_9GAMM|nr:hypothetical protein [Lysobacter lacus]TZF91431.1 hypothetical protein FW784_01745 [Lysobacter lacus]
MRTLSRYGPGSVVLAALVAASAPAAPSVAHWQLRGSGIDAQAVASGSDGEARVSLRCERGDPVLLLRIAAGLLPPDPTQVTLVADGTGMDYPVVHSEGQALTSRIALDAPILDRMLAAHDFEVSARGRTLATGSPGDALARVVSACRDLHWPRDARIAPSDAGLANR